MLGRGEKGWLDQWSRFPFQRPASACLGLSSAQGGKVRGAISDWASPSLSPDLPLLRSSCFRQTRSRTSPAPPALRLLAAPCTSPRGHRNPRARRRAASQPGIRPLAFFLCPRRPGNGRSTRGAAAKPASYSPEPREPCPPGPPCPPIYPPWAASGSASPGSPHLPVGGLPGPPPHPGAGLSAFSCPALGGGAGREGVSVSRARLGTCTEWRSTAGGAQLVVRAHGSCGISFPPSGFGRSFSMYH